MAKRIKIDAPKGFSAGGLAAGIKPSGALDLGMIFAEAPMVAAVITTKNRFPAAPVLLCRERVAARPWLRGVIVNSGNANAMTGEKGMKDAVEMTRLAEVATGCPEGTFLVASTGVIGDRLPMKKIRTGIPALGNRLSPGGWTSFAEAIMTTDTRIKVASRRFGPPGAAEATVLGIAKGTGMIEPDMATMLTFILTDFPIHPGRSRRLLASVAPETFHCLTVDGQTSTNDTVLLMSSAIGEKVPRHPAGTDEALLEVLIDVSRDLCRQMAADGEGATKLITVSVKGTQSRGQAKRVAKEVARSALVKTAICGENPNWGRIVQAMGQAGVPFLPENITIKIEGVTLVKMGNPTESKRAELKKAMKRREILIEIEMGGGKAACEVWTCDLTHGYIDINTEYT